MFYLIISPLLYWAHESHATLFSALLYVLWFVLMMLCISVFHDGVQQTLWEKKQKLAQKIPLPMIAMAQYACEMLLFCTLIGCESPLTAAVFMVLVILQHSAQCHIKQKKRK